MKLRQRGQPLAKIAESLGCSLSTVAYHLYAKAKATTKNRVKTRRATRKLAGLPRVDVLTPFSVLSGKVSQFHRRGRGVNKVMTRRVFSTADLMAQIGAQPCCYLTGTIIDLSVPSAYSLDHKVPISRGGSSELSNAGLSTTAANKAKHDKTPEEFLALCRQVLEHRNQLARKSASHRNRTDV